MITTMREPADLRTKVIDWLLDSDPAIRWQVKRDLLGAAPSEVEAERGRVANEGWGARLLALQDADGQWGRGSLPPHKAAGELPDPATRRLLLELQSVSVAELAGYTGIDEAKLRRWQEADPVPAAEEDDEEAAKYRRVMNWFWRSIGTYSPSWTSTTHTLVLLRDFGIDPADERVQRAVGLVRENSKWDHDGQDYFDGEVEACINGKTVALGAYFGESVDTVVERLLGEQLEDGGWNCEAHNGPESSVRSSFHSTIEVLDGLLAYEQAGRGAHEVEQARLRAQEYLLERQLFRRNSTGEVIDEAWLKFSFPPRWHYDVLRGLDYLRRAGVKPDARLADAIALVRSKRQEDGRWLLENTHPGHVHFALDDGDGEPSRWNTLRAMRVLDWYDAAHA